MREVSYSEARQNLASILTEVCADNSTVYINRKNGDRVVVISASEYESMDETAYLLRTEANLKHLQDSLKQADSGDLFSIDELNK